jgi:hypothetical protein
MDGRQNNFLLSAPRHLDANSSTNCWHRPATYYTLSASLTFSLARTPRNPTFQLLCSALQAPALPTCPASRSRHGELSGRTMRGRGNLGSKIMARIQRAHGKRPNFVPAGWRGLTKSYIRWGADVCSCSCSLQPSCRSRARQHRKWQRLQQNSRRPCIRTGDLNI